METELNFNKLRQIASVLGNKFTIFRLLYIADYDLKSMINVIESKEFKETFRKVSEIEYEFIDNKLNEQLLQSIPESFAADVHAKDKLFSIMSIYDHLITMHSHEKSTIIKEHILSSILSLCKFIIEMRLYDKALLFLDFLRKNLYPVSVEYEETLYLLALTHYKMRNFDTFISIGKIISIYPDIIAKVYDLLHTYYYESGNQKDLDTIFVQWDLLNQEKLQFSEIEVILKKSDILYKKASFEQIISLLKPCVENYESHLQQTSFLYGKMLLGTLFKNLGNAYFELSDYQTALQYYLNTVDIYKNYNFKREIIASYNNIAEIYTKYKKYDKAIAIYKINYTNAMNIGDKLQSAVAIWNIGETYFKLNDYIKAEKYFSSGEKLFFESDMYTNYENYLKVYFSKLYISTQRFDLAESIIDEVLISTFEKEEKKEYAQALSMKGFLLAKKGEDSSAYFDEALSIFRQLKLHDLIKETERTRDFIFK